MKYIELIDGIKEISLVNSIMYDVRYNLNYNTQIKILKELLTEYYSNYYNIDELIEYILNNYKKYNLIFGEKYFKEEKLLEIIDFKFNKFNIDYYSRSCSKFCEVEVCLKNWKITKCIENIFNF
jgi:hypothetical protein